MTSLMSKSSLYDMVSMIIPGYLFILCVEIAGNIEDIQNNFQTTTSIVVVFAISWFVGLLLHYVSKDIFGIYVRNSEKQIKEAKEETKQTIEKERGKLMYYLEYYKIFPDYPRKVIPIIESQVAFLRTMLLVIPCVLYAMLEAAIFKGTDICECGRIWIFCISMFVVYVILHKVRVETNNECHIYDISLIFIIGVVPIVFFLFVTKRIDGISLGFIMGNNCTFISLLFIEIIMFYLMRLRQQDVYKRIYEDTHYIKMIKTDETNN